MEPDAGHDAIGLLNTLTDLRQAVAAEAADRLHGWSPRLVRGVFRRSAENLAHYIALRRRDLRGLQSALMELGLSSLGRCESRVMPSLDAVIGMLAAALGRGDALDAVLAQRNEFFSGMKILQERTTELFGPPVADHAVRITATLPEEAARDPGLVRDLLRRGASCFRINCAHDNPDTWHRMIEHVRAASRECGGHPRVCMDLCGPRARTTAVLLPPEHQRVRAGDRMLLLTGAPMPASSHPIQVGCSVPEVVARLVPGAAVLIDEGKVTGVAEEQLPGGAMVRVVHTPPKGARIGSDKGMNFPGTDLLLSPLTAKDLVDLDFVARHADVVGYSFVQSADDVALLQEELRRRRPGQENLPLIAKIETERAVRSLPDIMVQGAGQAPLAVMIARGDLAVELGFPRLAEIQEEILWLCEAAHVPVVWATQVLDRMVRKGSPSRAELTDAAMAERAECVMLNKGPYAAEAVGMLHDVLGRMESHQTKKTSRLRALRSWS